MPLPMALTVQREAATSRAVVAGHSIRAIAAQLGRAPSTISRQLKRNGGQEGYRASQADQSAWDRGRRPKTGKLARNRALARLVAGKLQRQWSPEQVAGWLKRTYADDTSRQVSPETIYRSLFIQARGALKKANRRRICGAPERRAVRAITPRRRTSTAESPTPSPSASVRPALKTGRCPLLEGDLLFGSKNSQIATLVERQSRYVMLARVRRQRYADRRQRPHQAREGHPDELYQSLTWDRGKEMADHQRFTLATDIKVYFCDPESLAARIE